LCQDKFVYGSSKRLSPEALSEWAIDFDSIQEEELGSIIETYKTAFPDLPIIRILINRYNSYIEKLTGNIEL
jgi:hypothetical protein